MLVLTSGKQTETGFRVEEQARRLATLKSERSSTYEARVKGIRRCKRDGGVNLGIKQGEEEQGEKKKMELALTAFEYDGRLQLPVSSEV